MSKFDKKQLTENEIIDIKVKCNALKPKNIADLTTIEILENIWSVTTSIKKNILISICDDVFFICRHVFFSLKSVDLHFS